VDHTHGVNLVAASRSTYGQGVGHLRYPWQRSLLLGMVQATRPSMDPTDQSAQRPQGAWRVPISRPFAVGQLTGGGWLYAEHGALVLQGARPVPGPRFRVSHTEREVEVQIWRLMVPWIAVDAVLYDENNAVVVTVPLWRKGRLFSLMKEHGFNPRVRRVWYSTATQQARKHLLHRATA
jgi:hypothetical protein